MASMNPVVRDPPALKRVRWTVDEYFRMAKLGMFGNRRVELLNGEVIEVAPQANPHRLAITKASSLLHRHFPMETHWVVIQGTFLLSKTSAPDPDFHVFDVPAGTPDDRLPSPFLIIEVSDTTYRKDSGSKLRAYAAGGVRDYWIVNIPAHRVEVYRTPENLTGKKSGWRYADVKFFNRGQSVQPLARPDLRFSVEALLP
jgi:Uma2 family endonuclease